MPRHFIHEGIRTRLIRSDGTIEDAELREASAELKVPFGAIPTFSPAKRDEHLAGIAHDMARQIHGHMLESLDKTLKEFGQTVDAQGHPVSAELMLEVLEKMHIAFDDHGHPTMSLNVGPDLAARAKEALEKLQTDPILRERYASLMERKRVDWCAREASRKLVG